jgi:protease-4
VQLGLVDRIGTEEDARRYAAELVGLDPKTTKVFTIQPPKSFASKFLPNGAELTLNRLQFEMETSGMPLWMWK